MKNIPKLLEVKNNSIVGQGGGKSGAGAAGAIEASDNLISKAHIVVVDLLVVQPERTQGDCTWGPGTVTVYRRVRDRVCESLVCGA